MTKGMKRCFVPYCGNKENSGKILVAVPYSRDNSDTRNTRRKWFEAVGLPVTMSNKLYCCEDHFDLETDASNWVHFKTMGDSVKIKKEIVPHKFLTSKNPSKASQLSPTTARRKLEIKTRIQSGDVRLQSSSTDVKLDETVRDVTIPICSLEVQDVGCDEIFIPGEMFVVRDETLDDDDRTASNSHIDSGGDYYGQMDDDAGIDTGSIREEVIVPDYFHSSERPADPGRKQKRTREDMARFVCDLCGYKDLRDVLLKHMSSHIGDESCATCDCEAGRKVALKTKRLRGLGTKTFVCQVCSFTSLNSFHMNRHMTTHVVEEEEEDDDEA